VLSLYLVISIYNWTIVETPRLIWLETF